MTEGSGEVKALPKGWTSTIIGEVAECLDHKRVPINKKERATRIGDVPYYGANGLVGWIDDYLFDEPLVLVVEDETFVGREKPFSYKVKGKAWVNNHAHILRPFDGVDIDYLNYSLQYYPFIPLTTGTTGRRKLTQKALLSAIYILPPLNEQKRISEKIEELFSELEQGIENLKTTQKQLKVYRQAVLKWAFEGKLTEEWRKQHQSTLKTGEALLTQIKAERENRYQQQLAEWETAVKEWEAIEKVGKKPTKSQKLKELPSLTESELGELPELPNGWCWIYSGELFVFVTSGSRGWAQYYSNSGAIFIRITNLDFNSLNLDLSPETIQCVSLPSEVEGVRAKVQENDFLFSITGYLGMFAIIPPNLPEAYVNQHIVLARPCRDLNYKYFGYYFIADAGGIKQFQEKQKGATKAGLTLDDIQTAKIPIPSSEEQEQIVEEIESRLSICDQLESTIIENLQKAEALRQSILKQAFEGKLVPQDPNDEPAEKLLEQIRLERQEKQPQPAKKQLKIKGT